MDMNDRTNHVIVGVVAVILVAGAWYVGRMQVQAPAGDAADSAVTESDLVSDTISGSADISVTTPSITASGESVTVADQPAGSVVKIASLTLSQLGWVEIRDSKGWVLGAGRFEAGTRR